MKKTRPMITRNQRQGTEWRKNEGNEGSIMRRKERGKERKGEWKEFRKG